MDKTLRGIGVTTTEKLGELLLTVSIGASVHITSLVTGMGVKEVAQRLRELADKIES